jgi:hypothetical protein
MARTPRILSIANLHGVTVRAGGFAIAGTIGAAGIISIKSITHKAITTKR